MLTPDYVAAFAGPYEWLRTVVYIVKASRDEITRLILQAGLIVAITRAVHWRAERLANSFAASLALIALVQLLILFPQLVAPANLAQLMYDVLRFGGPGMLWGWLLLRHGFAAAVLGHTMTHPVLDPLLNALLNSHHA